MNRFKFISSTLLFIVVFLFTFKFTFYPVSSYLLRFVGISYDFSNIEVDLDGNISISDLSVIIDDLLEFSTEKIEIGFSRRTSGFLKKDIVVKKFLMHNSVLTFDSEWLTETTDISIPDELPYFPLEEIDIDNLKVIAVIDRENGAVADRISLRGNRKYILKAENNELFAKGMSEKLMIKLNTELEVHEYVYLLSSLDFSTKGINLSGRKADNRGNFNGTVSLSLEEIANLFNQKAKGFVNADFALNISHKVPNLDVVLSTIGIEYEGFLPWDIHAFLNLTPTIMHIDRLNLFHNNKVFLSLDGEFPYKEKKITGVTRLYGFDLDNCLDRMTTSGIVNLIVSGKADYVFSTETLSADTKVKLTVDEFDVDNEKIMKLPRKVYVDGNVTVGADGVKLHNAIVKTRDETSRLIVKNSFYGFADTMKFHIPIVSGSWINLEDVGMITGFPLKGQGSIEALVTSFYENPLITGKFTGSDCFFDGFSAQECSISADLKNFLLKIGIDDIRQRSLRSKGSWVSLDFDKNDMPVAFKITNVKGDIKDGAAVFNVDAQDVSGKFSLDADGVYTEGISKLNAKLRTGKVAYSGTQVADSISINLINGKDKVDLKDTSIKKGESSIVLSGSINKKDLFTDISAQFSNLTPFDLTGSRELTFTDPVLNVRITGALNEPEIITRLDLRKIIFSEIEMGDFKVLSKYDGRNMNLSLKGALGSNIRFNADIPQMNFNELDGLIDVNNFVYKVGDVFVKTSAKGKIEGEEIDVRFTTLMFEKAGFFLRNIKPFNIAGTYDELVIDKTYFDGETANFAIEGSLKKLSPFIKLKGTAFPRMIDMIYPNLISGIDGKFYIDLLIEDENINGEIRLANGSYKLTNPQILFNDVNATVSFNNRKWKVDNFRGFAGGGKAVLRGEGTMFPFDNASLKLKLVNLTGKHSLVGDFGVSSDLDIIMFDPEQISISGMVELKNVVYNRPLSLDSEFIKLISDLGKTSADSEIKESTPIDLDIKVTGKNNIRIKTNLIESDIFIDTTLTGNTEEPKMSGTVSMKNARIEYKQNDFTVQRGILTFEESRGISPFLDVESFRNITTKIQDDEKDYKIIMYATGYVLDDDLKLTFDSIPQLDQQQLISLLLWGNTGENITGDLAIAAVTDIMGITTAVRNNFRLSRFELIPKYSELDDKTVLKLVAEKEIYDNLFLLFESNPADTTDQIIQLKYKNKKLEAILEWHNKDRLENSFGGIGFDLKLEYVFE